MSRGLFEAFRKIAKKNTLAGHAEQSMSSAQSNPQSGLISTVSQSYNLEQSLYTARTTRATVPCLLYSWKIGFNFY